MCILFIPRCIRHMHCVCIALNPPMKVTVTQANSSSLTVSWQAPSEICGGEFERSFTYTVQYAVSGSMSFNRSSGVGTLSTVLTGLSSGTDYDIVVFAITDTDDIMGQPSEVTNETTRLEGTISVVLSSVDLFCIFNALTYMYVCTYV